MGFGSPSSNYINCYKSLPFTEQCLCVSLKFVFKHLMVCLAFRRNGSLVKLSNFPQMAELGLELAFKSKHSDPRAWVFACLRYYEDQNWHANKRMQGLLNSRQCLIFSLEWFGAGGSWLWGGEMYQSLDHACSWCHGYRVGGDCVSKWGNLRK